VSFVTSPALGSFHAICRVGVFFPVRALRLSTFRWLSLGGFKRFD